MSRREECLGYGHEQIKAPPSLRLGGALRISRRASARPQGFLGTLRTLGPSVATTPAVCTTVKGRHPPRHCLSNSLHLSAATAHPSVIRMSQGHEATPHSRPHNLIAAPSTLPPPALQTTQPRPLMAPLERDLPRNPLPNRSPRGGAAAKRLRRRTPTTPAPTLVQCYPPPAQRTLGDPQWCV